MRSSSLALLALLVAWSAARPARAARCELTAAPSLVGRVVGGDALAREVDVRSGAAIEVHLVAPGRLDGKPVIFAETGAANHLSWRTAGCEPAQIRWRRVEPRMQHVTTPAPTRSCSASPPPTTTNHYHLASTPLILGPP